MLIGIYRNFVVFFFFFFDLEDKITNKLLYTCGEQSQHTGIRAFLFSYEKKKKSSQENKIFFFNL